MLLVGLGCPVGGFGFPEFTTATTLECGGWPGRLGRLVSPFTRVLGVGARLYLTVSRTLSRYLFEVLGLLVPTERGRPGRGEEWVFLVRHRTTTHEPWTYTAHRGASFGPTSMSARTPGGLQLASRRVLLVGAGAVGGSIAIDLARFGVGHLSLIDGDVTDPNTTCRQYAPVTSAGLPKVVVLAAEVLGANPTVTIEGRLRHVGNIFRSGAAGAHRVTALSELISRVDLVIDATADPPTTRYLAALARSAGKPFLHASATSGGWGGFVALLTPETGCWACLEHHRGDKRFPTPPEDPYGAIAPIGCSEETFTGTNADIASIAHHASRLAHHHLTHQNIAPGRRTRRDRLGAGLYVAALRDAAGAPNPSTGAVAPSPSTPPAPCTPKPTCERLRVGLCCRP